MLLFLFYIVPVEEVTAPTMNYFYERMVDDAFLSRVGMNSLDDRTQLVDFFDMSFRFVSHERGAILSEFISLVTECVARAETMKLSVGTFDQARESMNADLLALQKHNVELQQALDISDARYAELTTVNAKQTEGLAAFRTKVCDLKKRITDDAVESTTLRHLVDETESRMVVSLTAAAAADAACADVRAANGLLETRMLFLERQIKIGTPGKARVKDSIQKVERCRRSMYKLQSSWYLWAKRSQSLGNRCGCAKSIDYFKRTGIDLEWINAEALAASAGFQRELGETASDLRRQMADTRKASEAEFDSQMAALTKTLEDVSADRDTFMQQTISMRMDLNGLMLTNLTMSDDLTAARTELAGRVGVERVARLMFLTDGNGREKVCPVPTMDGRLIPLLDVYSGWMSGGHGEGLELNFRCPVSGDATTHAMRHDPC
jgi:hypothetical protein